MSTSRNELLNRKRPCIALQRHVTTLHFSSKPALQTRHRTNTSLKTAESFWVVLMVPPPNETVKLPQLFAGRSLRNLVSDKQMWSDLGSWLREANYSSSDCIVIHSAHKWVNGERGSERAFVNATFYLSCMNQLALRSADQRAWVP